MSILPKTPEPAFRLATKVNALTATFTILAFVGTAALLWLLQHDVQQAQKEVSSYMEQVEMARLVQVDFKKQVQEWKNILIRGHASPDFAKYHQQFFAQESLVRKNGKNLGSLLREDAVREKLNRFLQLHEELGFRYRKALEVFQEGGNFDYKAADALVRGADRLPTDLIDEITGFIKANYEKDKKLAGERIVAEQRNAILASCVALFIMLVVGNTIARRFTAKVARLAETMSQVTARKDYSLRAPPCSRDELGRLTEGFNEMVAQFDEQHSELQQAHKLAEKQGQELSVEIEERKKEQAELLRTQTFLASVVDNLPLGVFIKDAENFRFVLWSSGTEYLTGISRSEAIGKTDYDLFTKDRADLFRETDIETLRTGKLLSLPEQTVEFRTHRQKIIQTQKVPVRCGESQKAYVLGIAQDITERRKAENQLLQLQEELIAASREAGKSELATGVLHNVGNVLNNINVASQCVADNIRRSKSVDIAKLSALLAEHQHDLGTFFTSHPKGKLIPRFISQLAERMEKDHESLLKDLADLQSSIEHVREIITVQQSAAKSSGAPELFQITSLFEDALRINLSALERHGIKVVKDFAPVPPSLIHKSKVLQILVNLIRNARQAFEGVESKILTLRVAQHVDRILISVSDNGIGIPPEVLPRIFAYGFTTKRDGHGFGLHSARLAATEMGGLLAVESEGPGKGATFTVSLPFVTMPAIPDRDNIDSNSVQNNPTENVRGRSSTDVPQELIAQPAE